MRYLTAVLGASGYAGVELLRLLENHTSIQVTWVGAQANAGKRVGELYGHLGDTGDLVFGRLDDMPSAEVVFSALPHGMHSDALIAASQTGSVVVDLAANFRLSDPVAWSKYYDGEHPGTWTYGIPELNRDAVAGSKTVACPGCYPTAIALGLAPLLAARAIDPTGIVCNALSGASGAGRKDDAALSFSELSESAKAYAVGTHRHTPEIVEQLSKVAGASVDVVFTPHLVAMARGILSTSTAKGDATECHRVLTDAYLDEPFVSVLQLGAQPATKWVAGTNNAVIAVAQSGSHVVVTCAIDNLGKGAAGQAIQNANLMLGLPEDAGLTAAGMYP